MLLCFTVGLTDFHNNNAVGFLLNIYISMGFVVALKLIGMQKFSRVYYLEKWGGSKTTALSGSNHICDKYGDYHYFPTPSQKST